MLVNYSKQRLVIPPSKDLTEEQIELIQKLREQIEAEWTQITPPVTEHFVQQLDDYTYQRFLAARSWVIKDAFEMLRTSLIWRTENRVNEITFDQVEPEFKKGKAFYHSYDKDGQLVCWIRVHLHFSSDTDWDTMQKTCIWLMEESYHVANKENPYAFVIFDLSNFSITKNMDLKLVRFLVGMFQNYYPETLGICVVLNAPWLFSGCWKLIKPFVDEKTANKVHFMNLEQLKEILPEEQIFKEIGGAHELDFNQVFEQHRDYFLDRTKDQVQVNDETKGNDETTKTETEGNDEPVVE